MNHFLHFTNQSNVMMEEEKLHVNEKSSKETTKATRQQYNSEEDK